MSGTPLIIPTKKAQALLAYCALPPGRPHQREKLAALLWGDTPEDHARNSLRQSLFVLRTALGPGLNRAMIAEGDTIALSPSAVDADAVAFERLIEHGTIQSLEQAAALYRGDLLEGFVVDEQPFEEWLLQERERLRERVMEVLARLFRQECVANNSEEAVQTARRLLTLDPMQETVHRALMRLYVRLGRRDAALRQYEACRAVLERELQVEPEPLTTQLYEQILRGTPVVAGSTPGEQELRLLHAQRECERARKLQTQLAESRKTMMQLIVETRKHTAELAGRGQKSANP